MIQGTPSECSYHTIFIPVFDFVCETITSSYPFSISLQDDLPSDYLKSVCFNDYGEDSCEKVVSASGSVICNVLWQDSGCSLHEGYVRDTCRKSCGTCGVVMGIILNI